MNLKIPVKNSLKNEGISCTENQDLVFVPLDKRIATLDACLVMDQADIMMI